MPDSPVGSRASLPTVAVILAGGVGSRAGGGLPKQFVRVAGKPVLQHTLEAFQAADSVDGVLVVADGAHSDAIDEAITGAGLTKLMGVCDPGVDRNASTASALAALSARGVQECKVLVHDGVRPMVDRRIIDDCVLALDHVDAVDVVIPSSDTIVVVGEDGDVTDIPQRRTLRRGQTPQAFLLSRLAAAYAAMPADAWSEITDDCAVVRTAFPDVTIATVRGSESNIKVTHATDFVVLDQLFRLRAAEASSGPDGAPASLRGQVVVVIGGRRGIGAAVVRHLERAGSLVVALGRDDVDVRDERAVRAALADVARRHGRIDAVVLTAGVLLPGELAAVPAARLREVLDTNLWGAVSVARAAHEHLARERGQLLFFASSSYTRGRGGYALYSATKAAVANLTQGLAEEWHLEGIRVNCLSPARTETAMRSGAFEGDRSLLSCDEVAGAALALLSSATSGSIVDVNVDYLGRPEALAGSR